MPTTSRRMLMLIFFVIVLRSCAVFAAGPANPASPDNDLQVPISSNVATQPRRPRIIPCGGMLNEVGVLERMYIPDSFDQDRVQCGLFDVPLDWARPELGYEQLHYTKYLAASDVEREGTIFVNPGYHPTGPSLTPQQRWMLYTAPKLHNSTEGKYDIVIWNVRGYSGHPSLTRPKLARCFDTKEESDMFYRGAGVVLGVEPAWGGRMEFLHEQTYEDAKHWFHLQSMVVEQCVRKQNTTLLGYMGTAATVRDLVAMADTFDGSGSPVNFWGMEYGAHVGQYLLQMFPERAGRVILQAPQGLDTYLYEDTYETWRHELTYAHTLIGDFVKSCIEPEDADCSTYWHDEVLDQDDIDMAQESLFKEQVYGMEATRNSHETDSNNSALAAACERPGSWGDPTYWLIDTLNEMQYIEHLDDFTLGVMPVYCGDKSTDYNQETAATRIREIEAMLEDDIRLAPFLSSSIFPPLDYLCHIWPIRAVERLRITTLESEMPETPAVGPLIIQYSQNPFARFLAPSSIVPRIKGAHNIVQLKFGVHGFEPETDVGRTIVEYLLHGGVTSHLL
ncbi:hypothetical protein C8Q70DRAFT_1049825 [Cubamyces menziesii]|nr:hypothetical protein C8Q70DRAFT_1049825 [Cubamyces menziesii]